MAEAVKVGIIGCGPGGAQVMYAPIWRFLQDVELVALWDPDPENARTLQRMISGGDIVDTLDDFWAQDLDAAIVSSPVYAHAEQTIAALERGLHVFCEKPMARSVQECQAMVDAAATASKVLMVGFMKRYDKSFLKATEMVEAGELGKLFEVRCDWSFGFPRSHRIGMSRERPETWGGVYQDHGSHTIDLARWWLGDISHVSGEIHITDSTKVIEDHGSPVMRHAGGGTSVHTMSRVRWGPVVEKFTLIGTEATLEIDFSEEFSYKSADPFRMILYTPERRSQDITLWNERNLDDELRKDGRYTRELQHFIDCTATGAESRTPGINGLRAIEAIMATFYSSWTGRKIKLPFTDEFDFRQLFDDTRDGKHGSGGPQA